jgi:FAD/FMN-containing dehydrogenase
MESFPGAAIARAGNGVCYGYFEQSQAASVWMSGAADKARRAVIEFAPDRYRRKADLWPSVDGDFEIMKRIKQLFDPQNLLNRGRLYRRI